MTCKMCKRCFISSDEKNDHKRNHANFKYSCPSCGYKYGEYEKYQEQLDCCVFEVPAQDLVKIDERSRYILSFTTRTRNVQKGNVFSLFNCLRGVSITHCNIMNNAWRRDRMKEYPFSRDQGLAPSTTRGGRCP